MTSTTYLLIVDPQNDFCDLPASYKPQNPLNTDERLKPQLPVPGAHADMHRLAHFIRRGKEIITDIAITLDSHHHVGIERPAMWRQRDGSPVAPFTQLTSADVRQGKFVLQDTSLLDKVLTYLDTLEAAGRYTHMIWPTHCELGTWGHNIHPDILAACNVWEHHHGRPTVKVLKGDNPHTEHYSALMAEVPDPKDDKTQLNRSLLEWMQSAGTLLVAGEAGSHCVRATMEHYAEYSDAQALNRVVLLTDSMSPITGFEEPYQTFLAMMQQRGAQLSTTTEWLNQQAEKRAISTLKA